VQAKEPAALGEQILDLPPASCLLRSRLAIAFAAAHWALPRDYFCFIV
jgi:hypothetical protein